MTTALADVVEKRIGDTIRVAIIADQLLDRMVGDDLTISAVTVADITAEDGEDAELSVSSLSIYGAAYTDADGNEYAIGHVFSCLLSGGTFEQGTYRVLFRIVTSDGQIVTEPIVVEMVG